MTATGISRMKAAEWALLLLLVGGLWRVWSLLQSNGYLGPPFVFDVGDTFMDWFNTAYWAHNGHAYDVWRTIYLPLSFVITGLFGDPRCYSNAPYDARDCDVVGIAFIVVMYLGCGLAAWLAFRRNDRRTAVIRTLAIVLGQPLLYALERGQLIMLTFISFALLYGGVVRSRYGSAFVAAFMANTKVYMVFPLLALGIKRDWRLLELCGFATVGLYLLTMALVGAGTPSELIANLQNWFGVRLGTVWDEMLYTTTYKPLLQLDVYQYPVRDYVEQRWVDAGFLFVQIYVIASRLIAWACIVAAWLAPRAISMQRLVFFILMQSFIDQNPGGYALSLIAFLVFLERARNAPTVIAIVCAYLISIPGDLTLVKLFDVERTVWLTQRTVTTEYVAPWGAFLRPGLIALILWALAIDSLQNAARMVHRDGALLGLDLRSGWRLIFAARPVGSRAVYE